jgi:hypothetical protein
MLRLLDRTGCMVRTTLSVLKMDSEHNHGQLSSKDLFKEIESQHVFIKNNSNAFIGIRALRVVGFCYIVFSFLALLTIGALVLLDTAKVFPN